MSKSKTHPGTDWSKAAIKCAIEEKGASMAQLARANGYDKPRTFYNVLRMSYPKVERIVAEFLETTPEVIWPSRYVEPIKITPSIHRKVA
jgi:Ner family transcriptional regulator